MLMNSAVRRNFPIRMLFAPTLIPLAMAACRPGPAAELMVILYADDSVVVLREAVEYPALTGMRLRRGDVIHTGHGSADVQSRNGVSIRLRELTTARIAELQESAADRTRVALTNGSLLARVRETEHKTDFAVITPTISVEAGEATFQIDVAAGRRAAVQVLAGQVAFAPRLAPTPEPVLSKRPAKGTESETNEESVPGENEPSSEPDRSAIAAKVILEAGKSASLKPDLDRKVMDFNTERTAGAITPAARNALRLALAADDRIRVESKLPDPRDQARAMLLIRVRPDLLERVAREAQPERIAALINKEYNRGLEEAVRRAREMLGERELRTEGEIAAAYGSSKKIVLRNGETIIGAPVARAGKILLIHSIAGVLRKNKNELDDYDDTWR